MQTTQKDGPLVDTSTSKDLAPNISHVRRSAPPLSEPSTLIMSRSKSHNNSEITFVINNQINHEQ
jgi:hypothetical protein